MVEEQKHGSQELSSITGPRSFASSNQRNHNARGMGSVQIESPVISNLRGLSKVNRYSHQDHKASVQSEHTDGVGLKKIRSNLKGTAEKGGVQRRDQNGVKIEKGAKRHKVTFRDEAKNEELYQLYLVDSYKKYNQMENKSCCCCTIF